MKFNQILLFIIICSFNLYAQSFNGTCVYKYKFDNKRSTKDTLIANLYFNNYGESYYIANIQKIITQTNSLGIENDKITPLQKDSSIVYRNIINHSQIYTKNIVFNNYIVSDTLNELNWEFLPNKKLIGKFACNEAKVRFSGRNYTAWYTTDIPVSSGPWKLHGLPGLIVEVFDDLGLIYYLLDKVEINSSINKTINILKIREKSITKSEFRKKEQLQTAKIKSMAESYGSKITISKGQGMELEDN